MNVLIVDDNIHIVETISDYLELGGYIVDYAYNGVGALELIRTNHYDAVVMDVMMPKLDGFLATKKIREDLLCDVPIIFLTAKDNLKDKKVAFLAGGDDYLVKPFAMEELSIRLQALACRGSRNDIGIQTFNDISFDRKNDIVVRAGKSIKLNRIQKIILSLLIKRAPHIVSKQELISTIWGEETPDSDALRSHIYGLRSALDKGFVETRIETVHGKGYKLKGSNLP
jgi:DNA-binding response OmpR family regulator